MRGDTLLRALAYSTCNKAKTRTYHDYIIVVERYRRGKDATPSYIFYPWYDHIDEGEHFKGLHELEERLKREQISLADGQWIPFEYPFEAKTFFDEIAESYGFEDGDGEEKSDGKRLDA